MGGQVSVYGRDRDGIRGFWGVCSGHSRHGMSDFSGTQGASLRAMAERA